MEEFKNFGICQECVNRCCHSVVFPSFYFLSLFFGGKPFNDDIIEGN